MRKKRSTLVITGGWILGNVLLVFMIGGATFRVFSSCRHHLTMTSLGVGFDSARIADIDLNGSDELTVRRADVTSQGDRVLSCFSPFMHSVDVLHTFFIDHPIQAFEIPFQPVDIDRDGIMEIPLVSFDRKSARVRFIDAMANTKQSYHLPLMTQPCNDQSWLISFQLADLEADGRIEALFIIGTAWRGLPRGIVACDLTRQERLWEFPMGSQPFMMRIMDINGDGRLETIVSTLAPHNGAVANGTDDDHSYLIILDHNGRPIIPTPLSLGGAYTKVFFECADIDADGVWEIIVSKACHQGQAAEPGEITIFNGRTLKTENYFTGIRPQFSPIHLLRRGRQNLLVVGDDHGHVRILDHRLKTVRESVLDKPAFVLGACPLGPESGPYYIAVLTGFDTINLLDESLRPVLRKKVGQKKEPILETHRMLRMRHFHESAALLEIGGEDFLLRRTRTPWPAVWQQITQSRLIPLLFLAVLFNALLWLSPGRKALSTTMGGGSEGEWESIAQEIAHRMKTPLFTIQLESEKMKTRVAKEEFPRNHWILDSADSVLEDVGRLKSMTRSLMKVLGGKPPTFQPVDVNALIGRIIGRYRGSVPEGILIEEESEVDSSPIRADPDQLDEAISNIIDNAVEALPEGGRIRIATLLKMSPFRHTPEEWIVEIEDNGCGIPAEDIGRVFEPYFTTKKEGSGLGLVITRRIIEAHGGTVELSSRPGLGTRFAFHLPLHEE